LGVRLSMPLHQLRSLVSMRRGLLHILRVMAGVVPRMMAGMMAGVMAGVRRHCNMTRRRVRYTMVGHLGRRSVEHVARLRRVSRRGIYDRGVLEVGVMGLPVISVLVWRAAVGRRWRVVDGHVYGLLLWPRSRIG
jgi:hypothetical protein